MSIDGLLKKEELIFIYIKREVYYFSYIYIYLILSVISCCCIVHLHVY